MKLLALIALLPTLAQCLDARNNGKGNDKGNQGNGNGNGGSTQKRPNFIYILADDQDAASAGKDIMPLTHKYITQHGTNYTNFFAPVSQCCPSRAGFFRSQHGHSHNLTYVAPPYGGWPIFHEFGYAKNWLPVWLQNAGYYTTYVGKIMNGNSLQNAETLPSFGFNDSAVLLDPGTYLYYNSSYSFNNGPAVQFPGVYQTDHIRDMAIEQIDKGLKSGQPFWAGVAPTGPHFRFPGYSFGLPVFPPEPAARHAGLFNNSVAPRGTNFNPNVASGASYMRDFAQLNQTVVDYNDEWYRMRLRTLQANDELVEAIYKKVEAAGQLDNTFIMYTSDNGFSLSSHRRNPGKTTGYNEDINVPFVIRGPGVAKGKVSSAVHANIDLSASMLQLAEAEANIDVDGKLMDFAHSKSTAKQIGTPNLHLSEFFVFNSEEGLYARSPAATQNNTYRVVRSIEKNSNWHYSVWCTGERELYDMATDVGQMNNLLLPLNQKGPFAPWTSSIPGGRVASRLDAVMLYLKNCHGANCRRGWENIFPWGEATTLEEALDPKFDSYFDGLPKVHFDKCRQGFIFEEELPFWTTELPYYLPPGGGPQPSNGTLVAMRKKRDLVNNPFSSVEFKFPAGAEA